MQNLWLAAFKIKHISVVLLSFRCSQKQPSDDDNEFRLNPQPKHICFSLIVATPAGYKIQKKGKKNLNSLVTTPFMFNSQWARSGIRIIGKRAEIIRGSCLIALWWNSYRGLHGVQPWLLELFTPFPGNVRLTQAARTRDFNMQI